MSLPKQRYSELDCLRGIAALMVLFFHLTMGREEANVGFKLGTTGVDLFFIISGFVISMSIHAVAKGIDFVVNRISRLYPTYWASITFTFFLITIYGLYKNEPIRWGDYFGNLTMFQYYLGIQNLDEPYWTMIVEMNFYIFILILFQLNILRFILPIGICITLFVGISANFFWTDLVRTIFKAIPLLEFFPLFFSGMIFYQWRSQPKKNISFIFILLLCLITQIFLYNIAGRSASFISHEEYAGVLLIFFILFFLFVHNKLRFIVNRPLLFLGKISFALYLIHQYLLLGHILPMFVNRFGVNFWIASLFVCVPISIAVAASITYFVEIPYSAKMKNWLRVKFVHG